MNIKFLITKNTETWNQYFFSTFKIVSGGTPDTKNKEYWGGDVPWIGPSVMSDNHPYISFGDKFLSEMGAQKLKKLVIKNSVIISSRAPVGYIKLAKNDLYTNQGCLSLTPHSDYNSKYIYFWLKHNKNELIKNANGTTFLELSINGLKKLQFKAPQLPQQTAIADILSAQESIVEDTARLVELRKQQMAYLSEELLSGRKRVRMNGDNIEIYDNTEWQQVMVNGESVEIPVGWEKSTFSVFKIISGGTPDTKNNDYWNGNIPWIGPSVMSGNQAYISSGEKFLSVAGAQKLKKLVIKNSVIISSRAPVGYIKLAKNDLYTNQGCLSLTPHCDYNSKYIYFLLKHNKNELIKNANGTTFLELSINGLKKIQFQSPKLSEQTLIADILTNQEGLIEQTEQMLALEKKKMDYLMNSLLSGEYRVEIA